MWRRSLNRKLNRAHGALALTLFTVACPCLAATNRWTKISPGGNMDTLAAAPSAPGVLYAAYFDPNVWRSEDGGLTWEPRGDAPWIGEEDIKLFVDPIDSDTLYLCSDIDLSRSGEDPELAKSTDGGKTWVILDDWCSGYLAIHPRDNSIMYRVASYCGVMKSTDAGITWRTLDEAPSYPHSVAIDPSTPQTVYVGTGHGVSRTIDAGATWLPANSGLPNDGHDVYVGVLKTHPDDPHVVYAGTNKGLFRSNDNADSWARVGAQFGSAIVDQIAIAPRDSKTLFVSAGSTGLYVTRDGGKTWRKRAPTGIDRGADSQDLPVCDLGIDAGDPDTMYVRVDGLGLMRTTDAGVTWSLEGRGLPGQPASVACDPERRGVVYCTTGSWVLRSDDSGDSWRPICDGLPDYLTTPLVMDPRHSETIYIGSYWGVSRSQGGGRKWKQMNQGLGTSRDIDSLALAPSDPDRLIIAGYYGLFESLDSGSRWRRIADAPAEYGVDHLVFDPSDSDVLYAAERWSSRVFRSDDGGRSWNQWGAPIGGADNELNRIVIDPKNSRVVYALTDDGVYRRTVREDGWIRFGPPAETESSFYAMTFDPDDSDIIYLGLAYSNHTIYRSKDGGATWSPLDSGLSGEDGRLSVYSLTVDAFESDRLFAGTEDGVYSMRIDQ
ncbi:MAG: hypothetical protein HYX75_05960 [Acidobacteria bacterium]|nr:hypothetical protein [Acidobacteriota bacterium]